MSLPRQLSFWFLALAALIAFLWLLGGILLPFIAGLVLAYFLDPVADALERFLPRWLASLAILGAAVLLLALVLVLVVPVLATQLSAFIAALPGYLDSLWKIFNETAPPWLRDALASAQGDAAGRAGQIAGEAAGLLGRLLTGFWSGSLAVVNLLSLLTVTPIIAYYMLTDWDRIVARVDGWLPRPHAGVLRRLAGEMDDAMAGFIRGQGTVCMLLGLFYAIGLSFTGLSFGLLIGFSAGLLSFIPYAGSILGGAAAIGVAVVQFWPDWPHMVMVAGVFLAGQFIEGNFLSPKLVGKRVGLHPVWLMFALFAFGYLFGFVGLLLAVPLAASIGVIVRFGLSEYLKSALYLGPGKKRP